MAESSKSPKTPREGSLLAIYGHRVILTTAKVHNFCHVYWRDVTVFALLDVQHYSLGTCLKMEAQLGAGFEVFSICVVAQLTILGQAERVETAFDIKNY